MGRSKTSGIHKTDAGYDIDKLFKGERIRKRGFVDFKSAQIWLIDEMGRIHREKTVGKRIDKTFAEAAVHYLKLYANKATIESDIYHLKTVMPYVGKLFLHQVHNETLKPFIDERKAQGRKNKTINLSLSVVRRILNLSARDWRDVNGHTWLVTPPLITMLPLIDQRAPKPIMWDEQRRLLPLLPDHLAKMSLFVLNSGVRDDVVCNLQWSWEVPIPQLQTSAFVVPTDHVKGVEGKKTQRIIVCNSVAKSIIDSQRGKHETHVFVYRRERIRNFHMEAEMPYRPIVGMNNSGWCTGRKKADLGDLHVHDLRHTVGLRLREAGVAENTISDILWHSTKTMTRHYSMAQIVEIFEALEKIKNETNSWNISLQSLIHQANTSKVTQKSPTQRKTG